jgi:hypothetical protein
VGDGRALDVKKVRKLQVKSAGRHQKTADVLLENVKFIPSLKDNLFSLSVAKKKGAQIKSEETNLIISKGCQDIFFNHKIEMGASFLVCAKGVKPYNALILETLSVHRETRWDV